MYIFLYFSFKKKCEHVAKVCKAEFFQPHYELLVHVPIQSGGFLPSEQSCVEELQQLM